MDNINEAISDLIGKLSEDNRDIDIEDNLSYVLIRFGDIGPEPVLFENTSVIFDSEMADVLGTQLGIYLSLLISKGKPNESNLGIHGPFPWTQTPEHNILAFSFLGHDKEIKDPRAKEHGLVTIIAIFYKNTDQELIKAKLSIENELRKLLITDPLPEVGFDNLPIIFAQTKTHIQKSIAEGDRIIQENAMDSLLSNERLVYLGLYQSGTRELIAPLVGEEEDYKEIIDETKTFNFDIFFTKFKNLRFGLINMERFEKIVIMIISDDNQGTNFMEKDFQQLYQSIYVAAPLLEEYYG